MDRKIINDALAAQEKSKKTTSAKLEPNIWRTIMNNRITKFAAAAVIIIAVLIGINQFGGSINITTVALAQVTENMKKMPWMHLIIKGLDKGKKGTQEKWVSFEGKGIWISKELDGSVIFLDYGKHKNYTYDPVSRTITSSYLHGYVTPEDELLSPLFMLEFFIKEADKQNAEITRTVGVYQNKDVEINEMQLLLDDRNHKIKLLVDSERALILAGFVKSTDSNNNIVIDAEMQFEYPEHGPANIYDVGVPGSAKLVSNLPPDYVLDILAKYQSCREKMLNQYIAVVTDSTIKRVEIIYRNGNSMKTEHLYPRNYESWTEYSNKMEINFDSLLKWWTNNDNSRLSDIYLYDGQNDYFVYGLPDEPKSYKTQGHNPNHKGLADIGWPNISQWISSDREFRIIDTDYSMQNSLICIEALMPGVITTISSGEQHVSLPTRSLYYIDPYHDYICVKADFYSQLDAPWHKDTSWLDGIERSDIREDSTTYNEVVDLAQANSGHWYPKKIKKWTVKNSSKSPERITFETVYLKTNPEFPEGIFDPDKLPQ